MLYHGQIIYGFVPVSRKFVDNLSQPNPNLTTLETLSNLAQFTSTWVAQFHIYIVYKLRILELNVNNERDNEPNSLKQAIHYTD